MIGLNDLKRLFQSKQVSDSWAFFISWKCCRWMQQYVNQPFFEIEKHFVENWACGFFLYPPRTSSQVWMTNLGTKQKWRQSWSLSCTVAPEMVSTEGWRWWLLRMLGCYCIFTWVPMKTVPAEQSGNWEPLINPPITEMGNRAWPVIVSCLWLAATALSPP